MARAPQAEVSFMDCDGDKIRLIAERQGTKGRVSLFHNGTAFQNFVTRMAYTTEDMKLYVNGHEATIQMQATDAAVIDQIEKVCDEGLCVFSRGETIDAAKELAKVKQKNIEELIDAMEAEGLSKDMIEKAKARQAKDADKKKKVPKESLTTLLEMGIPEPRAVRALALGDGTTPETAITYIEKHSADPNLDKPLEEYLVPEWTLPLTADEKAKKAAELQQLLEVKKAERLAKDREHQKAIEKSRRKDGQDKQEWKEEHEKRKRLEAYEEKKREKERDRLAREAVKAKIAEERLAKGWKPLPEDKKDNEQEKDELPVKKVSAAEFFGKNTATAADDDWDPMKFNTAAQQPQQAPVQPSNTKLPAATGLPLPGLTLADEDITLAVNQVSHLPGSVKVLKAYVSNIVGDPFNPKFRTIKTTNNAFQKNIAAHPEAVKVLYLLGFRPAPEVLNISSIHLPTVGKVLKALESA
eukprot:TRINITY_DN4385_c0_g1_i1.p1 TRINITY_DN4385_c0_g1~~TRINITY_DN4385_c0_g1_i1.p1  ORF type:complete len:469 (+),score=160.11 TRINITY_DN4385_c0_g1_i1:82-1488(+)